MTKSNFTTSLGALITAIGSAVGLGNIWRFPYKMGSEGGALFLLGYIIVAVLICIPLLVSEFLIGRAGGDANIKCIKKLHPNSSWWLMALVQVFTGFTILCFYNVIGGWIIYYIFSTMANHLTVTVDTAKYFNDFLTNPYIPILFLFFFILIGCVIVVQGVQKGIERYCTILIPMLGVFLVGLMLYSFTLPNVGQSLQYLFMPKWEMFSSTTMISVISQAFFSLSLGMGIMMLYGSYMKKEDNLVSTAIKTTLISAIFVSIVASILVFNIIFAFGIEPSAGPSLVFIALPKIFSVMTGGIIIGSIFYILVLIAALTSAISLLEVAVAFVISTFNIDRKVASWLISLCVFIIGSGVSLSVGGFFPTYEVTIMSSVIALVVITVVAVLSYKPIKKHIDETYKRQDSIKSTVYLLLFLASIYAIGFAIYLYGSNKILFDILDGLTDKFTIPIGGLLVSLFLGWVLEKKVIHNELSTVKESKWYIMFMFVNKYLAPLAIITMIIFPFI